MNMANSNYQDQEFDYQADYRRATKTTPTSKRRANYSRSNRPVVSHNGIHRRRNKRFSW
jgi:hypothetical protein